MGCLYGVGTPNASRFRRRKRKTLENSRPLQGGGLDTRYHWRRITATLVISVFPLYFKFALLGHPPERESFITHSLLVTCSVIAWSVFFIPFAVSPLVSLLHNSPLKFLSKSILFAVHSQSFSCSVRFMITLKLRSRSISFRNHLEFVLVYILHDHLEFVPVRILHGHLILHRHLEFVLSVGLLSNTARVLLSDGIVTITFILCLSVFFTLNWCSRSESVVWTNDPSWFWASSSSYHIRARTSFAASVCFNQKSSSP